MIDEAKKHLENLRTINLGQWIPTFWLIKRKINQREGTYDVLRVDIAPKLKERFKDYFKQQFQNRDLHIDEYAFNNSDLDDVLLAIDNDITDFRRVEEAIGKGFDNNHAKEYEDLLNSWAYVIEFEHDSKHIFAWRKIDSRTQSKKARSKKALYFRKHKLVDVDDDEVFLIDSHFDFFVYAGIIFIADKRAFEISMNFRDGIRDHCNKLLKEPELLSFLGDTALIREYAGNNLHHLRKLASIQKAGYYRQKDYLDKLIKISAEEGWELKTENGKIVVELASIELLLKLLNNDRLRSPINQEVFDSTAKKPIRQAATTS